LTPCGRPSLRRAPTLVAALRALAAPLPCARPVRLSLTSPSRAGCALQSPCPDAFSLPALRVVLRKRICMLIVSATANRRPLSSPRTLEGVLSSELQHSVSKLQVHALQRALCVRLHLSNPAALILASLSTCGTHVLQRLHCNFCIAIFTAAVARTGTACSATGIPSNAAWNAPPSMSSAA
jgi:hypothetical protein